MNLITGKNAVHVEICLKPSGSCLREEDESILKESMGQCFIKTHLKLNLNEPIEIEEKFKQHPGLQHVESFLLECDAKQNEKVIIKTDLKHLVYHLYCPHQRVMEMETFDSEAGGDDDAVPSSSHWILPSNEFIGLWENLIYEEGLKEKLLKFALSALTFSQHHVNQNVVCCNRLILLHGPPGTGKTSLCKALTQKLSIRTNKYFRYTHLIEINSHSLFSKWFSESGKLVMRLFGKLREIIADPHSLVCVLIDEVESLAYARDCMSGQEPKDAMRVVNALLTQLDSIKQYPNVLVMATSNLANSIDLAFLDRADIKQHIGLPTVPAIRHIYESVLIEMMRVGIVVKESLSADDSHEDLLNTLAERSVGLSGRTLRKLPFLAHALHAANAHFGVEKEKISLSSFLDSMLSALEKHRTEHALMQQ